MRLVIVTKKGKPLREYSQFNPNSTVGQLLQQASKDFRKSIHRMRFTYVRPGTDPTKRENKIALTDDKKTFRQYNLTNDKRIELIYKDLGPQISWKTVFLVEYFGPLLAHALPYFFASQIYGQRVIIRHPIQNLAFALILFHYVKREFETLFIHRFSNATMPAMNIFKNSFHYWVLGGALISYFLYHPRYTPPSFANNSVAVYGIAAAMVFCEIMNFDAHVRLRNLRPPGTKTRGIPKGQLFALISCANYFWEISAWFWFALLTNCLTSYFFFVVGAAQMAAWALKKHSNYKKEFGKKYPRRKAIFPFIL